MKIIVCMKQIYHTYARTGTDPDKLYIAPEDTIARINPYDEAALETALCFKDEHPETEIVLLTLGPLIAESELRRCLAMGADNIVHIDVEQMTDPKKKAVLLAKAVKEISADIVLCGKESLDTQNGQVGAFLAHNLGLPFVSSVLGYRSKNDSLEVLRSAGRGVREKVECQLPALFSIDLGHNTPRLPTYMAKKRARSFQIQKMSYDESETGELNFSANVTPPRPRPKKAIAPDNSLDSFCRIEQLLAGTRVEKKGKVLQGDPEYLSDEIINFLDLNGFLKTRKDKKNT